MIMAYCHDHGGRWQRAVRWMVLALRLTVRPALALGLIALMAAAGALPAPSAKAATVELVVSAAASLGDAVMEIKQLFEDVHPGVRLVLNFGSSGALQQQIERGAPVDVFISAAQAPVDRLVERGLVAEGAARIVAANRLALVTRAEPGGAPIGGWVDLVSGRVRRVAIGNPDHVPAGIYAKEVLESLSLWDELRPKLVFGEDVRQVLQYVRLGAAEAGIVYSTDAASSPEVSVVAEAPAGSHSPIVYPAAPIKSSRYPAEALAFLEFLSSETARSVLRKHGFVPAE